MARKFTIFFDTRPFVRSHMKEPRGRGSWAFSIDGGEAIFSPSMTLAEARRWVRGKVAEVAPAGFDGCVAVQVLP
jgi:hypothetical protein